MNTTPKYTAHYEIWPQIAELRNQGLSLEDIANRLYKSRSCIVNHIGIAKKLGHYVPRSTSPEGKRIGKLCLNGHDFNGTGMSLRDPINYVCIECQKERNRRYQARRRAKMS